MRGLLSLVCWIGSTGLLAAQTPEVPRSLDPRLEITLFAAAPDIVHPIAIDFDSRGRLLVIESHTHFPPKGYKGPSHDRIVCVEDTDGDGKADRFTPFLDGLKHTMDLAVHADGSVYVATRNEILRLRDTDGDGKADQKARLAFLETDGDYPHNGLSGLAFDAHGSLRFGMGENLGVKYRLIAADGTTHLGGGEGGNVFAMTRDGGKLRRVATGFWNPFGVCRDIFDRWFAVDNDPDAMPPCRMLHVVEGADYGFQFRYGRSGRHAFQAWNGELPGTLPYVCGVGEAPSEVISYESDGLPRDFLGDLLVTSWADHRLERYTPQPRGASFGAKQKIVIQGGKDFRPVGLAVAPDGSLFLSDWVLRDYTLHGKGALWHVRPRDRSVVPRPTDPSQALTSLHRPLRESAARKLATTPAGLAVLRSGLKSDDVRVRATSLEGLTLAEKNTPELRVVANQDPVPGMRRLAVRALVDQGQDVTPFLTADDASVRFEAILGSAKATSSLGAAATSKDPFLRHAAVVRLAGTPEASFAAPPGMDDAVALTRFLAHRLGDSPESRKRLPDFLASPVEDIRFLAAKWIADEQIKESRPPLEKASRDPSLNSRLYLAYATALARIDNQQVNELRLADIFLQRVKNEKTSPEQKLFALRMIPTSFGGLTPDLLAKWSTSGDPALRLEAVRALSEHPSAKRLAPLLDLVTDAAVEPRLRAQALLGLADEAPRHVDTLLNLACDTEMTLAQEACRTLVNVPLDAAHKARLKNGPGRRPESQMLVARVLGEPFTRNRPDPKSLDAWLQHVEGAADAEAGRRVFFHPRLAGCFRCHRVDGRGRDIGPDLTTIGQRERRFLLESILHPGREVAPHYQTWHIETTDGKVRTGLLTRTYLDEYTYVDEKGTPFTVNTRDLVETRAVSASIMPDGLVNLLTDQELRDLLAFLTTRR